MTTEGDEALKQTSDSFETFVITTDVLNEEAADNMLSPMGLTFKTLPGKKYPPLFDIFEIRCSGQNLTISQGDLPLIGAKDCIVSKKIPVTFFPTEDGAGIHFLLNGIDCQVRLGENDLIGEIAKRNALLGLIWIEPATTAADEQDPGIPSPLPLAAEDTKARTMLQNPGLATFFGATVANKNTRYKPFTDGERGGLRYLEEGGNALALYHQEEVPIDLRTAKVESEAFEIWARSGVMGDLSMLDDTSWDIAALGVTAFYARTDGTDIDKPFPLLFSDYYEWRSTDPRKRSEETNRGIQQRIELLSDVKRVKIFTRGKLHLPDKSGRLVLTEIVTEGSFFGSASKFWRTGQLRLIFSESDRVPDGYLLRLGEWAREYVKAKAMLGMNIKRLAEYDLRRQLWERRIGWRLVFLLQNQASKAKTRTKTEKDGTTRTIVKPQHPFTTQAILDNTGIPWEHMAKKDPGKVIRQFVTALETLKADGIIGEYQCIDGNPWGESLPIHGRLKTWLAWRWYFLPGPIQARFLRKKKEAAAAAAQRSEERQEARKRRNGASRKGNSDVK